jgi:hypothetical protein
MIKYVGVQILFTGAGAAAGTESDGDASLRRRLLIAARTLLIQLVIMERMN